MNDSLQELIENTYTERERLIGTGIPTEILALGVENKEGMLGLYSRVFAGEPWFEQYRCTGCGEPYGAPNATKESLLVEYETCKNDVCQDNDKPLELTPFYEGTYFDAQEGKLVARLGESIYLDAVAQEGFIGVAGVAGEEYRGFAWGYKLPTERSPSVWFDQVQTQLAERDIDASNVFYAAEVGVDPAYQRNGLGTQLSEERLAKAKEEGFTTVMFRTKNPKLVKVYERLFGEGNGVKLFQDPNPQKAANGVSWYAWAFADFIPNTE